MTMEEIFQAVKQGERNKAPGQDGICLEFIKNTREVTKYELLEVMNMYGDGIISDQQNHRILVCLPIKPGPTRLEDYRPLTLMNTDYKLFTRIIANHLRPWLAGILCRASTVDYQKTRYLMPWRRYETPWLRQRRPEFLCVY